MMQEELNGIKIKVTPPGPEAKKIIDMNDRYLARSTQSLPVVGKIGRGVYVEDVDGNVYLDFSSGISVTNLGHVDPYVTAKVEDQLHKMWHFPGTDFYTEMQVLAAKSLIEVTPGKFEKRVFFTNSGTESVEAAIKVAKSYTGRGMFIGFIGAFHGRTQGSLSFTASKPIHHRGFFPSMPGVEHVPYPNPYRNPFGIDGYENPDELVNRVIDYIETYLLKTYVPPEDVAGILAEPVQGEGGYIVPPMNFFRELRKLADSYNIPLMMDEVQSGFGRTGKFFASEHFGVEPDVITLAKAIASGIPMGAVVMRKEMNFKESGLHSNTFGGNLIASAACVATIEEMKKLNVVENSAKQGAYLRKRLEELQSKYDAIGDVRGLGLMQAIDFVKDRRTKEPNSKLRNAVIDNAFRLGLILLSTGSSAIRIIPPLIITQDQIDEGIEVLDKAIKQSL
ncbi:L-2, 4-diaminobutyrate:2-ketoglutarate 4-aminotransferase related protein [Thermoplasma acidophilum]|uniref:L-2, 4-diaminobutyrate:2-ketoglutarate 4-aminotransferase related protein n=1 Tax=Thermoplasma acidophilum (strain ATCC 25905 / DSM 1728 / JCM 9062 / NBRC 15155 / AMRC-C165) TaxID=273075 RepID=Q9HM03_THEAC|nr:acetyl ornithine aminotransferase family protein [Thermoplasma acidophilum]CAC11216.1 L-2, 4-diaminobutyrate:2-ketoglutarate 4-aminotransferase related protein [Thermoplasma acidophilum]